MIIQAFLGEFKHAVENTIKIAKKNAKKAQTVLANANDDTMMNI